MGARERFAQTRKAVIELNGIHALIMSDGDDWMPPNVHAPGVSDPTASRAIRNVDTWEEQLAELRRRETELENFIGVSLAIIHGVREGFGEIYANLLEWYYIDDETWTQISEDSGIKRSTCYYLRDVAFDWIDSVGVSRLLRGEVEI